MNQKLHTQELTKIALFAALTCASAYIIIPLPFSPVSLTAQTFIINLMALLLTPRQTAYTLLLYILLGLLGLPVFSGGAGGPGKLFGPTGGYIFSWLIAVPLMARLKGPRYSMFRYCAVTILAGMPLIYLIGTAYMKLLTGMNWTGAVTAAVLPFIPLDLFKCVAAAAVAKPVQISLAAMEHI